MMMKRVENWERQDEMERDKPSRFVAEQYISHGYHMHLHRNLEIYGVVKGKVLVTVAGESMLISEGQMVIVDGLENHGYQIEDEAEIFYVHVGTRYLRNFFSLHPNKKLPRWLMDVEYNQVIYERIQKIIGTAQEDISELKRVGITCQLFSDIIERYDMRDKADAAESDGDLVENVIQYIYEHYAEHITLETLSKEFYVSPKALGMKLRKKLNVDLRVFINDIRVQKVVQMRDNPKYKGMSLNDLASVCGFNDMRTFYRSYERNYGSYNI